MSNTLQMLDGLLDLCKDGSLDDVEYNLGVLRKFVEQDADKIESLRVPMLQYQNLRKCFHQLVHLVLGEDYYNLSMDVYSCDEICCEDIWNKVKPMFSRNKWKSPREVSQ